MNSHSLHGNIIPIYVVTSFISGICHGLPKGRKGKGEKGKGEKDYLIPSLPISSLKPVKSGKK